MIVQYLKGIRENATTSTKSRSSILVAFADSRFADNMQDGHSESGGRPGACCCCCWRICCAVIRTQQCCVTQHTTERKCVALAEVTRKRFPFTADSPQILDFIQPGQLKSAVTVFKDNGVIKLADNPIDRRTNDTKHIHGKHHFVSERVAKGTVRIVHVESERQVTDDLTNLPGMKIVPHRKTFRK